MYFGHVQTSKKALQDTSHHTRQDRPTQDNTLLREQAVSDMRTSGFNINIYPITCSPLFPQNYSLGMGRQRYQTLSGYKAKHHAHLKLF